MSETLTITSHKGPYEVHLDANRQEVLAAHNRYDCIVVDERVRELYANNLETVPSEKVETVPAKEETKTLDGFKRLTRELVDRGVRRSETILVIGGGVTQDVAAFTASVLYRGLDWEFVPTTLLAQCDSCIGSKTSINLSGVKNTIGTFHPPTRVYLDSEFLQTLQPEDIRSGIGEMLHYLFLEHLDAARRMMSDYDALVEDPQNLDDYIGKTLEIKQRYIEEDEFDRGVRKLLNYGHTFGHALEAVTDHAINHGQAVTVGMDLANHLAVEYGFLDHDAYQEMHGILQPNLPPIPIEDIDFDAYLDALSRDKKNTTEGNVTCILPHQQEDMRLEELPLDDTLRKRVQAHLRDLDR